MCREERPAFRGGAPGFERDGILWVYPRQSICDARGEGERGASLARGLRATKRRKVNQHWWQSGNKSSYVLEQQRTSWVCILSPFDGGSKLVVSRWSRWAARSASLALKLNGWEANSTVGCSCSMLGSAGMGQKTIWRPNWNGCKHGPKPSAKGEKH